jgi:cyclopropane-fatty-acyl-phospholipid synthase
MTTLEQQAQKLLEKAGVGLNGNNPWDIRVHNKNFFKRVLKQGSLGMGESYMDGWWDTQSLDEFFRRICVAYPHKSPLKTPFLLKLASQFLNRQSKKRAFQVGEEHYNIGNDVFQAMLDKRLTYTCGYWKNATTLDEAQEAKLDLICRKLNLQPGQKILDIGCGWGSLLKYAAEKYGVEGVGITVSKEQVELARELCQGLPIEIRLEDYRDTQGQFDHIVSVGMFEHVGYKNYRTYMETAHRLLKENGLFLLHSIGSNYSTTQVDPWIEKYIFPNGMLPSIKQIGESVEDLFVMEDWHNFGADYDKTLMAWHQNFIQAWSELSSHYSERFKRMWEYYLLSCAGLFRARKAQLWQIVLSKNGIPGGYQSIR